MFVWNKISIGLILILNVLDISSTCTQCASAFAFSTIRTSQRQRSFFIVKNNILSLSSKPTIALKNDIATSSNENIFISEEYVPLPSNITMQVICGLPISFIDRCSRNSNNKNYIVKQLPPILLFLHGSFHGAWCYQEKYIPYFLQQRGNEEYIVIAPSWRGTGGTPIITDERNIKIQDHVQDLYYLLQSMTSIIQNVLNKRSENSKTISIQPEIQPSLYMISHSFGGIVVMKFLEKYYHNGAIRCNQEQQVTMPTTILKGLIVMCSVPPSGNGPMTIRFLKKSIRRSYQITTGFAMKKCCTNIQLCRQLFFDSNNDDNTTTRMSDQEIQRYQSYFVRDSKVTIDLFDLAKQLPSKLVNPVNGMAAYIDSNFPKCLIIGAVHDYIVDQQAAYEIARYFGCYENTDESTNTNNSIKNDNILQRPKVTWIDSPHDVMLGTKWENGASTILQWIQIQQHQQKA